MSQLRDNAYVMSDIPSQDEILNWIKANPKQSTKRDIAKAFGIKGAARIDLKRMLKQLAEDGHIEQRRSNYRDPNTLPPVSMLRVDGPDAQGDLWATPVEWEGEGAAPKVLILSSKKDSALGKGDRILTRVTIGNDDTAAYTGKIIRKIGEASPRLIGVFRSTSAGGRIVPIEKGQDKEWVVTDADTGDAQDGELVEAEQIQHPRRMGLPKARVTSVLGDPGAPKSVSLIAIHQHGIPDHFPAPVVAEADRAKLPAMGNRTDLTHLPLITIDPSDARDHDDACCAVVDTDPENAGGFFLWVAIADVAAFVTAGSELDAEARTRGNSTYFPDRVVPMLPDVLSGDLCSLHEGATRPCIAVEMRLNAQGEKISHRFVRGMMKSPAALSYEEAQAAMDGHTNERTAPLLETVLKPLYRAYDVLKIAREERQPLALDLPERKVELTDKGDVSSIKFKDRLDAHKLIEECMVLANVAAAETLLEKKSPLLFRVHEEPSPEKIEALRETAKSAGLVLAKGQVLQTRHLNALLTGAQDTDFAELINISTLRSMTQAYYSPKHMSHFGLALRSYAHFTSPIRRYADLIVHRALVSAHGWGDDGLSQHDIDQLDQTATQISETERRSMMAERDTNDRYLASYMAERIGQDFTGRISGIARFGLFVKLDETGADGLVPMRNLGREYFEFDADAQTLTGSDSGLILTIGLPVTTRIAEAAPVTGGLILDLIHIEGAKLRTGHRSKGRGKPYKGKGKGKRAVKRTRR